MERKLSTILAADVVGYSRLMEMDEVSTLERLREHREELFEPEIAKHHGRLFKLMGDGLLVEFGSVVEAVACAVAIQRGMLQRNAGVPAGRRIELRIALNLGDVIIEGDDLFGDGVNIAARLQAVAERGGICVSGTVFDHVRAKLALPYQYAGEQRVKNISQPVRVYRVPLSPGAKPRLPRSRRRRLAAAAASVALLLVGSGIAITEHWRNAAAPDRDRPSIAVLPFASMSADPQQDYFADGMTEDLITDLAKVSGLFVISRNSTFVYKGKDVEPAAVAGELGVRYLLEGSVRRQGDELRINVQLIDTATNGHLWAERYDRAMTDVFALQDDITRHIVTALQVEFSTSDQGRLANQGTSDVRAYDAFLQGWDHYRRTTPQDHAAAIPYFERAIALDPGYGRAHAALALTYYDIADNGWAKQLGFTWEDVLARSRQHLDQALQHPTSTAYLLQGEWLRVAGRFDEAVVESERAVALDPSDSLALANLSNILSSAGRAQDGLDAINSAMRIDPHYPPLYLHYLAKAQFGLGHFAEAAASWEEDTKRSPESAWGFVFLASAYGYLGRMSEAKAAVAKADAGFGSSRTTVLLGSVISYKERSDLERFLDGLRKAGVPELPFGYNERTADRLSGDAIRALLFGHTMRGHDADGATFTVMRTADGGVTENDPAGSETGRSVIEGDRLCNLYPLSGRSCVAIFRNPTGTSARQDQYIIVSPWDETMFSVTE